MAGSACCGLGLYGGNFLLMCLGGLLLGYAVASLLPQETIIRDAAAVPMGAKVRVRVAKGRMDCEVQEVSGEQ